MHGDGLRNLSNEDLLARLDELTRQEKQLGAEIVAHLVEVERRSLHLLCGYSSLFKYCVEKLCFTDDMAYRRMQAARAAAKHPEVLEHLEDPIRAIAELRRVARHSVLITVPREPFFGWLNELGQRLGLSPDPGHVNFWTKGSFQRLVQTYFDEPDFEWSRTYQLALARV